MRQEFIKKFFETYKRFGFKSISLDDLAFEYGISKKTIYKYFENRDDVIDCVVDYFLDSVKTEILNLYRVRPISLKQVLDFFYIIIRSLNNIKPIFFNSLSKGHGHQYLTLKDFKENFFPQALADLTMILKKEGLLTERSQIDSFVNGHNNLLSTFIDRKMNDEFLPGMSTESYFQFVINSLKGICTQEGMIDLEKYQANYLIHH